MSSLSATSEPKTTKRQRLLELLASFAAAGTVVVAGLTLAGFGARWWWRLEQACHFRVQYAALLLIAALTLWMVHRRRLAAIAMFAAMINVVFTAPIYWPPPNAHLKCSPIRIVSFNVLSKNTQQEQVLSYLREQAADVVLLMEVNSTWAKTAERLSDLYPYQHIVARDDNFGIALLSRTAWGSIETLELGAAEVPSIVAKFDSPQGRWIFIGTHPVPPGSRFLAERRNEQLQQLAALSRRQQGPVVLAGDLNITSFSPFFQDLVATSGLRDSRQGRGVQASWGPAPGMEIAIDHCLVSPDIAVRGRAVGPHIGSDHRPVVVDFCLRSAADG
jgi:endonuclease/exonuclease/phosphatase (EEP) superfamily protein YafD